VGAAQVFAIEVNKHRCNIAQQMKADWMLDPSKLDPSKEDVNWSVLERTGGLGVDVVLEMAGHPSAIRTAFDMVRRGGRIPPRPDLQTDRAEFFRRHHFHGHHDSGIRGPRCSRAASSTCAP